MKEEELKVRVSPVFALLFLILYLWKEAEIFLYISLGFLCIYAFVPFVDYHLSKFWMLVAERIAEVVTTVLLTVVWFLLLTPMGVLWRRGKNPLLIRKEERESFWVKEEVEYSARHLEKPW